MGFYGWFLSSESRYQCNLFFIIANTFQVLKEEQDEASNDVSQASLSRHRLASDDRQEATRKTSERLRSILHELHHHTVRSSNSFINSHSNSSVDLHSLEAATTTHPKRYTASGTLTNYLNDLDPSASPAVLPSLDLPVSLDPAPQESTQSQDLTQFPRLSLLPTKVDSSSPRHVKILSRSASPLRSNHNQQSIASRSSCLDEFLCPSMNTPGNNGNQSHSPSFDTLFPLVNSDPLVPTVNNGLNLQTAFSLSSRPSETERYSSPPSPRLSMSPHVLVGRGVVSSSLQSGLNLASRSSQTGVGHSLGLEGSQESSPKTHYVKKLTRSRFLLSSSMSL